MLLGLAVVGIFLAGLTWFLSSTEKGQIGMTDFLLEAPIAHRGLFEPRVPENSLTAFQKAVDHGYLIELDVQLSKDGVLMVFHDENLERMTGEEGKLGERTQAQLQQLPLKGTEETMPTFEAVLDLVGGKVGILIEIKDSPDILLACQKVTEALANYEGKVAVQSFNPYGVAWFKKNAPNLPRGILAGTFRHDAEQLAGYEKFALKNLLLNFKAKPHFIAYQVEGLPNWRLSTLRTQGIIVLAWTIKDQAQWEKAKAYSDNVIFDTFRFPEEVNVVQY